MRILHVGSLSKVESNGVHRAIHTLAHLSMARGHEVGVLNFSRSADEPVTRDLDGVSALTLPVRGLPGRFGSHAQVLSGRSRRLLTRMTSEWDLLHLHSVFQVDHVFVSRLGVPFVVTPHGGYHPRSLAASSPVTKRAWLAAFDRTMLERAALVQTLSVAESWDVCAIQPEARTRVLAIPMAPTVSPPVDTRRDGDAPVVFIGRLDIAHKGIDLLLEGWAATEWGTGRGGPLVLAGPVDEPTARRLDRLVERLGVVDSVRLVGPVRGLEKAALLSQAKWFVHTSRWEGVPLSMLEAARAGVPLLATDETNLAPRISEHGAGLACEPTVASVADMLERAHAVDEPDRRRMARGAAELSRGFEPEKLAADYDLLYQDVVR